MPKQNLIAASVSDADQTAVLTAIETIKNKLPFLVSLTPDQRRSLTKMGDNSTAYVDKCYQFAMANSEKLGSDFGADEFTADYELFQQFQPIVVAMRELSQAIADTELAISSDLMVRSNLAYGLMKVLGKATGAFSDMQRDIGHRFTRGPKKAKTPATP